ncbi:hypothetical protein BC835DRAFT_889777 [Cytidiella melzeri]|nr:hypothetical protein BC835DRAFT_889777 [Cytidiella melzeri]
MSGIPPQLDVHPGTPTGEWAVQTTSALQNEPTEPANAVSMNPTTAQLFEEKNMRPGTTAETSLPSAVSTPGNEFPGAYPNSQEARPVGAEITSAVTDTARSVAQSVTETAQVYVPAAAGMIGQYLPKSMADKMSEYIPGMTNPQGTVSASEHDIAHDRSMPSTELVGARAGEKVGGVGALPGSLADTSVVKLPDERSTAVPATLAGAAVAATETAKGTATNVQHTVFDAKDRVTHGGHTTAVGPSSLPTRELDGAQPGDHSSGVGALPGSLGESGVAVLPDEGGRGITGATSAAVGTHAKTFDAVTLPSQDTFSAVSGGVGALPGQTGEAGVAVLPDERSVVPSVNNLSQPTDPKTGEIAHIADTAQAEGVKSADSQPQLPPKSSRSKAGAAAIGAAVGVDVVKKENAKDNEKKSLPSKSYFDTILIVGRKNEKHAELQADLLHINLQPRIHAPAGKGAQWAGKPVGGEQYHRGEGIDLTEGDDYGADYHPADMHPLEGDYSKEHEERDKEREPVGEKAQEKPLGGGTSPTDHDDGEKAKKVGFMAKMKGEAKVLLGKMEGKKGHDKVEEGQRIKGSNVHYVVL